MAAYEPLDLSRMCNTDFERLGEALDVPAGVHHFQGLPFMIGRADGKAAPCLLGFGEGMSRQPVAVPVEKTVQRVVVAHRLLDSGIPDNGPIGERVAEYRFHFEGGKVVSAPIRDRFEIGTVPAAAGLPFVAVQDRTDEMLPPLRGQVGRRRSTSDRGDARPFECLYALGLEESPPGPTH